MKRRPLWMTGVDWPGNGAVQRADLASILLGRPVSGEVPFWLGPRQSIQPFTPWERLVAEATAAEAPTRVAPTALTPGLTGSEVAAVGLAGFLTPSADLAFFLGFSGAAVVGAAARGGRRATKEGR